MSAAQKLLDIPPILAPSPELPALAPAPVYEKSLEGINATQVEADTLLPPPPPSPSQVVPPTSSRALRGQTSKSFSKGKEPALAVPGSSASPIIAASDVQALLRVGMTPAAASETAPQARARHNENEARLAEFVTSIEANVAAQSREHSRRLQELTLLVREVQTASAATNLAENPVVEQLRAAVVEDRVRITDMVNEVHTLRADIDGQRVQKTPPLQLIPPLPASFSSNPKRTLDGGLAPPRPKRLRTMAQQHPDVLYGPVDPDGSPKAIAAAAMELITGLHPSDVFSAKYAHNQPGVISIRFRSHDTADRFIESMEVDPVLEGQTAIPAGLSASTSLSGAAPGLVSSQSSKLAPQDIIRGVGKAPRRR